ncbi:MAG TPA: type II toxin-antitoxin system PemK/MazF family toxin [Fimbriimonas sp.]|nr:type II toxin-antitoxin system PemK/MazF family toxin [Fimbriimonas sp.]
MRDKRPLRRGDIWWVDWNPSRGVDQSGRRPALILQANYISDEGIGSVIVAAISTGTHGDEALHVGVEPSPLNGLTKAGVVKCEQIMTVSVDRLETYSGILEGRYQQQVDHALRMILALR